MQTIFGHWNRNGETVETKRIDVYRNTASWWNPNTEKLYIKDEFAAGLHTHFDSAKHTEVPQVKIHTVGNYTILADCRIDNRKELKQEFGLPESTDDAELILHAYKKYRSECVDHLLGAFVFTIYDRDSKKVFMARDHIGVKNLYYYVDENRLVFATHRKTILSQDDINKEADWKYIIYRFKGNIAVDDTTFNKKIKTILPAHWIEIGENSIEIKKYWALDVNQSTIYKSDEEYVEHFLDLFYKSVERRMWGHKQIGAHLSGGLDSSGVSAVAQKLANQKSIPFHCFSYVFPEHVKGKLKPNIFYFNDLVTEQIELSGISNAHPVIEIADRLRKERILHEISVCDGISWSNNTNTEYEIQKLAHEINVGVVMSGFPGDELVTSFCRPYYLEYLDRGQLIKFFRAKHRGKYVPQFQLGLLLVKIFSSIGIDINGQKLADFFQYLRKRFLATAKNRDYRLDLINQSYVEAHPEIAKIMAKEYTADIHRQIPLDFKTYQRNHVERNWTCRRMASECESAMYFQTEYRYPMADKELMQYVISLPIEQKRTDEYGRWIFRRAMDGIVPDSIRLGIKFSSFLKPAAKFHKVDPQDQSDIDIFKDALNRIDLPFIDKNQLDEFLSADNLDRARLNPMIMLTIMMDKGLLSV